MCISSQSLAKKEFSSKLKMPILVKDCLWEETDLSVIITVPLKGVQHNKVDIFSTEEYIKVSYPPYLFECFLFAPVEDVKGKATVGNGAVVFSLVKKEAGLWRSLQVPHAEGKEFMKRKRNEAIQMAHERALEEARSKEEQKREQERYVLRQQMKIEEDERKRVEVVKERERQKAAKAIEKLNKCYQDLEKASQGLDSDDEDDDNVIMKEKESRETKESVKSNTTSSKNISQSKHTSNCKTLYSKLASPTSKKHQQLKGSRKELFEHPLPAPREAGCIHVSFTPRSLKTAARESKVPEEQEWLKKVAEASRNKKLFQDNPDAVDMEEMNPLWLKEKGIGFYEAANYAAAINAFTAAIVLDENIPSLYSNRAACHLHMKQYRECIQDCTCALDLLTPPVKDNASSRCRAHVRRGTAFFHLNEYVEALKDYEEGLKLDPKNESLSADAERIRSIIQGTTLK